MPENWCTGGTYDGGVALHGAAEQKPRRDFTVLRSKPGRRKIGDDGKYVDKYGIYRRRRAGK